MLRENHKNKSEKVISSSLTRSKSKKNHASILFLKYTASARIEYLQSTKWQDVECWDMALS